MSFFELYKTGYIIRIKLTPSASLCEFRNIYVDEKGIKYLKAYVTTAPEKGKANKELIKMLSKKLKTPKNTISIISGETDHLKKIYISIEQCETSSLKLSALQKEK